MPAEGDNHGMVPDIAAAKGILPIGRPTHCGPQAGAFGYKP